MSGQTIAIIALVILLILTIGAGGVYAYFTTKSNSIRGHVTMATLNIALKTEKQNPTDNSDMSQITLSSTNVLPNQQLLNDPLFVKNSSEAPVCLIVVYKVSATRGEGADQVEIQDDYEGCMIDLGLDYINSKHDPDLTHDNEQTTGTEDLRRNTRWVDYLFSHVDPVSGVESSYRCLVSLDRYTAEIDPTTQKPIGQRIEVIPTNSLKLHQDLDNDYQTARLTFAFQAYVIGASDDWYNGLQSMSVKDQCEEIVGRIYQNQNNKFLDIGLGDE